MRIPLRWVSHNNPLGQACHPLKMANKDAIFVLGRWWCFRGTDVVSFNHAFYHLN